MARRLLSIWFPRLASDHALRNRPVPGPFALTLRSGQNDRLHCVNAEAGARGLHPGMGLNDARAICPGLVTRPACPVAEAAALSVLRRWAGRYAPLVAPDGPNGLIADITGVAHLFGNEGDLQADLQARLDRGGITAISAIAGTRGAAHALARHGGGIVTPDDLSGRMAALPVAALRIDAETAQALARTGLGRIGDLIALPRAPLARRFGPELALRLDQMLGLRPEPVGAVPDAPHFGVRLVLPDPIGLQQDVMAGLLRLLDRLCAQLATHAMGARRLRLELGRVDRETLVVEIGLARPLRDPARIAPLFTPKLADLDAGFGIETMRLQAPVTEPLAPEQITSHGGSDLRDGMADLISRLGNRIGFDSVQRLHPAPSLTPERSFRLTPAIGAPETGAKKAGAPEPDAAPGPGHPPPRPIALFPPEPVTAATGHPPTRFRWRRTQFTTLRATGPERIAPEWWLDDPAWQGGLRNYWRIETVEGPRLWMFHTPRKDHWSVQGEFA
ncbi:Y-family DNA polymerase [Paracoccus nototheniae]|uniref:Y-family DNA polymerase n=1 Tax=Paracoccus nototheniae TaxID=2489002 RepID=A0ABW4E214_9RHOB